MSVKCGVYLTTDDDSILHGPSYEPNPNLEGTFTKARMECSESMFVVYRDTVFSTATQNPGVIVETWSLSRSVLPLGHIEVSIKME